MGYGSAGASRRAIVIGGLVFGAVIFLLLNYCLPRALAGPPMDPDRHATVTLLAGVLGGAFGGIVVAIGAALPSPRT